MNADPGNENFCADCPSRIPITEYDAVLGWNHFAGYECCEYEDCELWLEADEDGA